VSAPECVDEIGVDEVNCRHLLFLGAMWSLWVAVSSFAQDRADRIFLDGKIWTGEGRGIAQALAVRGDRIVAVGTDAEVRSWQGPETAVVDLKGRLVVPGFNDAHWHFTSLRTADLAESGSVREIQRRLQDYARSHPKAAWITGRGWGYAEFPGRVAEKKYLDEILPDKPAFIWERDGHMGLANSKALQLAGITRDTPDPPHGHIERNARGEPTGELKEAAVGLVTEHIPELTAEDYYEALHELMNRASSYGITSLQNASPGLGTDQMTAFNRVLAEGQMKVRFYVSVPLLKDAREETLRPFKALRDAYQGPLLKVGSAKGVLDGTVDAKTALMFDPYIGGGNGIAMWTDEELRRSVELYDREGFQVWLHAIGDKAIHMALDSYEAAAKANGTSGRRHRIEHVEVPLLRDFPRFKELGVIASTQALFANPDQTRLENYAVLLGPQRASHANAFRLFDEAGAVQAFGSDFPVFSMEVLRGIYCAVTRKTPAGTPAGCWYPENRISVEDALRHFTADAAYASFDENQKGTLVAGKLADFVVLSEDILSQPPESILKAKVLLTVMGGRETYRAPYFRADFWVPTARRAPATTTFSADSAHSIRTPSFGAI
jgi:predicted amidohydrolase YtcJ